MLSGELATVLTGRYLALEVYPLSFEEFLAFKGFELTGKLDLLMKKTELRGLFLEYLEYGGFPEVVLSSLKKEGDNA